MCRMLVILMLWVIKGGGGRRDFTLKNLPFCYPVRVGFRLGFALFFTTLLTLAWWLRLPAQGSDPKSNARNCTNIGREKKRAKIPVFRAVITVIFLFYLGFGMMSSFWRKCNIFWKQFDFPNIKKEIKLKTIPPAPQ